MMDQKTCGEIYQGLVDSWCGGDVKKLVLFAAGFVHGQAEKVYLGACQAAMFRVSEEHAWFDDVVASAKSAYGLDSLRLGYLAKGYLVQEVWIFRPNSGVDECLTNLGEPDSGYWHLQRAALCGIDRAQWDPQYHLRPGYNAPCDKVK